jgi:hypothetical protein
MSFFCPHNRQLYISSDYKLDEGRNTPTMFNLKYDGGIFLGLYNIQSKNNHIEPFPEGTTVSFPLNTLGNHTVQMRGTVVSVPIPPSDSQLPLSDITAPPYTIRLVDGSIHTVSPDFLETIVVANPITNNKISFPSCLGYLQKVMYLHNGTQRRYGMGSC